MRNNYSTNDNEKDKHDDSNSFTINLSLLTERQRKLISLVRGVFLPQVLKDQGLLEGDENDKADLIEDETERLIHNTEIVLKHHQRIQKLELKLIKLWESYDNEVDSLKRE